MGLFNKERPPKEPIENNFGLVLTAQPCHQSISSVEEILVVVQDAGFPGIVGGANAPYGVKRILHHEGFSLL